MLVSGHAVVHAASSGKHLLSTVGAPGFLAAQTNPFASASSAKSGLMAIARAMRRRSGSRDGLMTLDMDISIIFNFY